MEMCKFEQRLLTRIDELRTQVGRAIASSTACDYDYALLHAKACVDLLKAIVAEKTLPPKAIEAVPLGQPKMSRRPLVERAPARTSGVNPAFGQTRKIGGHRSQA
jgi:hypothetical protein